MVQDPNKYKGLNLYFGSDLHLVQLRSQGSLLLVPRERGCIWNTMWLAVKVAPLVKQSEFKLKVNDLIVTCMQRFSQPHFALRSDRFIEMSTAAVIGQHHLAS